MPRTLPLPSAIHLVLIATSLAITVVTQAANFEMLGIGQALSPGTTTRQTAPPPQPTNGQNTAQSTFGSTGSDGLAQPPQTNDYATNNTSDVFGARLFTGAFARQGVTQFNPDYAIAIGDQIQIRLWGAFEFDGLLTVDPKGNIFIPHAGPVALLGVRNQDLQRLVESAIAQVFRTNVFSYASLAAAQPVRIFVTGFVNRPGLYRGTSMDSLLHYLDQAGGIDTERGSFLNITVKRGERTRGEINLYTFLLHGTMPLIQLADGDVILVAPRQNTVKVSGLAENTYRFEYTNSARTVADLIKVARPKAAATHVRVVRNTGAIKSIEYYPLSDADEVTLQNGDELIFTADKKPGTITVRVEGEHLSAQEYVLPYGARMIDIIEQIEYSERSDQANLQLFRESVKVRQKALLQKSLNSLEAAALTARSGTTGEALLRKEEAGLILQWVDRARQIEPSGQVIISDTERRNTLLLENGDILRVPTQDGLVLVSGEVLFPNAIVFDKKLRLDDYIDQAGGFTQNANEARIVIARRDGSFFEASGKKGFFHLSHQSIDIFAGDEILVLPKIDVKSRQIWKDMTQIIYQIAVSAKVVLGL